MRSNLHICVIPLTRVASANAAACVLASVSDSFVCKAFASVFGSFIIHVFASIIAGVDVSVIFSVIGDFMAYSAAKFFTIVGSIDITSFAGLVTTTVVASLAAIMSHLCHCQCCRQCLFYKTQFGIAVIVAASVVAVTLTLMLLLFPSLLSLSVLQRLHL